MSFPKFLHVHRSFCVVGLSSVIAATACSLLINLDTQQCTTDSDCAVFGQNYQCSNSSCVLPSNDSGLGDAGLDAVDAFSCTSNAECIDKNFGEPYLCQKSTGQCLSIKLPNVCAFVAPN